MTSAVDTTYAKLGPEIAKFFNEGKKHDLLLFYFSGHGFKYNGHLYLGCIDTDPEYPNFQTISDDILRDSMEKSAAQQQVIILDCCRSGTVLGTMGEQDAQVDADKLRPMRAGSTAVVDEIIIPDWLPRLRSILEKNCNLAEIKQITFDLGIEYENLEGGVKSEKIIALLEAIQRRNLIFKFLDVGRALNSHIPWDNVIRGRRPERLTIMTSSGPDQDSYEFEDESIFTHYLVEGMRSGQADLDEDGRIHDEELFDYVREHTKNYIKQLSQTKEQIPKIKIGYVPGMEDDHIIIAFSNTLLDIILRKLEIQGQEALRKAFQELTNIDWSDREYAEMEAAPRVYDKVKELLKGDDRLAGDARRLCNLIQIGLIEPLKVLIDEAKKEERWQELIELAERYEEANKLKAEGSSPEIQTIQKTLGFARKQLYLQKSYELALEHFNQQKFGNAIPYLVNIISHDPHYKEAVHLLHQVVEQTRGMEKTEYFVLQSDDDQLILLGEGQDIVNNLLVNQLRNEIEKLQEELKNAQKKDKLQSGLEAKGLEISQITTGQDQLRVALRKRVIYFLLPLTALILGLISLSLKFFPEFELTSPGHIFFIIWIVIGTITMIYLGISIWRLPDEKP